MWTYINLLIWLSCLGWFIEVVVRGVDVGLRLGDDFDEHGNEANEAKKLAARFMNAVGWGWVLCWVDLARFGVRFVRLVATGLK